jgi:hypothetical protein
MSTSGLGCKLRFNVLVVRPSESTPAFWKLLIKQLVTLTTELAIAATPKPTRVVSPAPGSACERRQLIMRHIMWTTNSLLPYCHMRPCAFLYITPTKNSALPVCTLLASTVKPLIFTVKLVFDAFT